MKKQIPVIAMACMAVIWIFTGCYYDNREELYPVGPGSCDTLDMSFQKDIKPIMDKQCATAGCHASLLPTGYDLSTYAGVYLLIPSGRFLASIDHTGPFPMPKDLPKMDDCSIAKIAAWIHTGAPDN